MNLFEAMNVGEEEMMRSIKGANHFKNDCESFLRAYQSARKEAKKLGLQDAEFEEDVVLIETCSKIENLFDENKISTNARIPTLCAIIMAYLDSGNKSIMALLKSQGPQQ